jgi:hypothetical protein
MQSLLANICSLGPACQTTLSFQSHEIQKFKQIWCLKIPYFSIQIMSWIWDSFYEQNCSSCQDVHNHILFAIFLVWEGLQLVDLNSKQFNLV